MSSGSSKTSNRFNTKWRINQKAQLFSKIVTWENRLWEREENLILDSVKAKEFFLRFLQSAFFDSLYFLTNKALI